MPISEKIFNRIELIQISQLKTNQLNLPKIKPIHPNSKKKWKWPPILTIKTVNWPTKNKQLELAKEPGEWKWKPHSGF